MVLSREGNTEMNTKGSMLHCCYFLLVFTWCWRSFFVLFYSPRKIKDHWTPTDLVTAYFLQCSNCHNRHHEVSINSGRTMNPISGWWGVSASGDQNNTPEKKINSRPIQHSSSSGQVSKLEFVFSSASLLSPTFFRLPSTFLSRKPMF